MTTLLVTGAGGPAGRALGAQLAARAAAGADLTWVGVDIVPVDDPNYPATDHAPRADAWDYVTGMRDLVVKHAPDLVIPTVQDELPQVAVLAQTLDHATTVLTAAPGPAALAADKLLTMLALDRAGVPVPRYALPTDFESVDEALAWAHGPVVIKPRVSRGGRGVRLVESAADLSAPGDPGDLTGPAGPTVWTALDASWIVQTFAEGTEYCPQLFRPTASAGTPGIDGTGTTAVVLEKTVLKQGRVGNAAAVVRPAAGTLPDVEDVARRAVAALGLTGPADLDIRRDATGAPLVLEVNGRFGANSEHTPELLDAVLGTYQHGTYPDGTSRPAQAPR
ncbi:ATP-grasp domain-containing protein [Promicromonospora sukumoe]|uniref:Carbamoyl-phosphate synthase large subunit n=1 Tax=Promicromonospora sukumoe TaxID=88382 RepID=A0A7W3PDZ8_9MICO|nr:ATP-grasp domain-containing protein [Promicromonospora sukumoe]MBA8808019.1 carbamoyl-phosphate synthase large subunit [Promicromonospora sukumoe]